MLLLSAALTDVAILSLRTTALVATATAPIINPNNLRIEGWYCNDRFSKESLVLLTKDIREILPQGFAINDYDDLTEVDELVRLRDIMKIRFELAGKAVITENKRKVGKVSDYAMDTKSLYIQKLYISEPLFRNFAGGQLSIDRSQIVEITDTQITVRDVDVKSRAAMPALSQA